MREGGLNKVHSCIEIVAINCQLRKAGLHASDCLALRIDEGAVPRSIARDGDIQMV